MEYQYESESDTTDPFSSHPVTREVYEKMEELHKNNPMWLPMTLPMTLRKDVSSPSKPENSKRSLIVSLKLRDKHRFGMFCRDDQFVLHSYIQ